ncbi:hypothetical protein [Hymenobacter nivis]|uniref:hypothetical protein n=1 Tax=Hymenobacter nivis TaxID=1850093 RepID=UPI001B87FFB7|nr:hypothetical protein [Hymenobacter nivis]
MMMKYLVFLRVAVLGLGFRYAPLYGLSCFKTPFVGRVAKFKFIDLRYGHY